MKVYTGGGDKGQTSLFSGERVPKHHIRIEAYGDMDELNSALGAVAAHLPSDSEALRQNISVIQSNLFIAGAWLATTPGSSAVAHLSPLPFAAAKELERHIDQLSEALPPLKAFILPGGSAAAAWAHIGRTVCRRCERRVTQLMEQDQANDNEQMIAIQVYLNRLSDYLFVVARFVNQALGCADMAWRK